MLLSIHVKNFALIDEAEIELSRGLNILTGETGAGKSILIDAVTAALGGRVKSDVIGHGGESAYVELSFLIDDADKRAAIEAMGISCEYDCILVSRRIYEGRSVHKINDETVTAARARAVTELLIDIHGQSDHQSLIKETIQLEILDHYAGDAAAADAVKSAYNGYIKAQEIYSSFNMNEEERRREIDFLEYEIREIESAALKEGEEEELSETLKRYRNASKLSEDLSRIIDHLSDGRDNATDHLSAAVRYARSAAGLDGKLDDLARTIEEAEGILSDAVRDFREYADGLDYDPQEFARIENRLDEIHHIQSKYGGSFELVMDSLDKRRIKAERLVNYERERSEAALALEEAKSSLDKASELLSNIRKTAAAPLADDIAKALYELNFLDVRFEIAFGRADYGPGGWDTVSYLISTNPGEPLLPMAQVASGGELSRIMLGIKTVLSDKDEIPSLIFDEIDTGISGRTAALVGRKLCEIARLHQVICITHLPQIAAGADAHFLIEKGVCEGRTLTEITKLDADGEIAELARLLGADTASQAAYENARELKIKVKQSIGG